MQSHRHRRLVSWFAAKTVVAAAALALAGCHPAVTDPHDPRFIVAEKPKDWAITRADLSQEVDLFLRQQKQTRETIGPAKMPVLESRLLRGMVLKKLLLERATQMNIPAAEVDKEADALMAQVKGQFPSEQEFTKQIQAASLSLDDFKKKIREDVLIRKVLEADALHNVPPEQEVSEQEIEDFYLKNKDKFVVPDKVRASRIVIMVNEPSTPGEKEAKKKEIDQAHARVMKGEDFGKVASEVSEDRYSAPKGGDIGYFQKGENEDNFDTVAFATKPGVVSPVFLTPMGYQFLKVTEVQPGGALSIAQVRDMIGQHLSADKVQQAENAYTRTLPEKNGVIFHLVQVDLPPTPSTDAGAATPPPAAPPGPDPTNQ
jgi:parvulin-like peptidyl-prolyl isomerase